MSAAVWPARRGGTHSQGNTGDSDPWFVEKLVTFATGQEKSGNIVKKTVSWPQSFFVLCHF